jgi:uncharacterized membrane protein SirB2
MHVSAAMLSGALFFLRGLSAQVGIGRPMAAPSRDLSYSVDTVLLAAALTLIAVLPSAVFANGRLVEKLSLVIVYVWLGSYALKRGRTPRTRLICFLFALLSYARIVAVARAHDPLGSFWRLA